MKQINGWYNIHNFNNQCCGQIKVAIIPSLPLSPSKSSKYFKKYDIVEPCNLDLAFFSVAPKTTTATNSTPGSSILVDSITNVNNCQSSVSLFYQLRQNLHDLDTITRNIRNRSEQQPLLSRQEIQHSQQPTTTSTTRRAVKDLPVQSSESSCVLQEQSIETIPSVPMENTVSRDDDDDDTVSNVSSNHAYIRDEPNINGLGDQDTVAKLCVPESIHENKQACFNDFVGSSKTTNGYQEPSIQDSLSSTENTVSGSDTNSFHGYSKDGTEAVATAATAVDTESVHNDSTDDLLEHLKEFERKYKHLKTIVQNDSDFTDSDGGGDDCGVDRILSPAFSSPRAVGGHHHHHHVGAIEDHQGVNNFFGGVSVAGDSFFDQVVNVTSSGEPSKEEIHDSREEIYSQEKNIRDLNHSNDIVDQSKTATTSR